MTFPAPLANRLRPRLSLAAVALAAFCGVTVAQPPPAEQRPPRVYFADPSGRDTKDPSVARLGDTYFLYYSQNQPDGTWRIGVATSDNLLDWTARGTLALKVPPGKLGCAAPGVRVIGGKVRMFFQSYGGEGSPASDAIVYAESEDGLHFTQPKVQHLIRPGGAWNNNRAIDAEPLVVGDELFCYWATRDPAGRVQMVGVSKAPLADRSYVDPAAWQQVSVAGPTLAPTRPTAADPADIALDLVWEQLCIEAPTLVAHGGRYYLFYAGAYNNDPQQIGVAVSEDAVSFRRMNGGRPLLEPGPAGAWNASESGHPGVFHDDDGRDYLFYQGDNLAAGVRWHISMVPIAWDPDPAGGPDVPRLDFESDLLKQRRPTEKAD